MKTSDNGIRLFWVAAVASLVTGFVHSESAIRSSRELLGEQERLLQQRGELKAELYLLRSELAEAQAEARTFKRLCDDATRVR